MKKTGIFEANGHEFRYFLENVPKIDNFDKIAERMSDNLAKMLNEQK
ncbi:hypothetical protein AWH56_26430 [Anaerobacillus isosaccharinicus]|uniref:Uncharacterized protein n=1 Tax=Anaerobacillus isosaccharinicus TaxID=1532552 RepID=A0AC62A496_9BACI